jgi:predicted GNAT family acetyltransferase
METTARRTGDVAEVLADAGAFLAADPVRNNVVRSLLAIRVTHPEPGDYWIVERRGDVVGLVFRSPLDYLAALTPMDAAAVASAVDAMAAAGVTLPGVNGDATTAARFAGAWAARTKSPATPVRGQRIFEVTAVVPPRPTTGRLRDATADDRDLLVDWVEAFHAEIDEGPVGGAAIHVDRRLEGGLLRLWDDGGPVSLAGITAPVDATVRIGPVYTPPAARGRGYASALVAAVSQEVLDRGGRCILYTDLDNPTSNAIYRAIGYRVVEEVLRYRFTGG